MQRQRARGTVSVPGGLGRWGKLGSAESQRDQGRGARGWLGWTGCMPRLALPRGRQGLNTLKSCEEGQGSPTSSSTLPSGARPALAQQRHASGCFLQLAMSRENEDCLAGGIPSTARVAAGGRSGRCERRKRPRAPTRYLPDRDRGRNWAAICRRFFSSDKELVSFALMGDGLAVEAERARRRQDAVSCCP